MQLSPESVSYFLAMYSKINLINVIKAIKNDPKAIDPQFQKIPHLKDLQTLAVY